MKKIIFILFIYVVTLQSQTYEHICSQTKIDHFNKLNKSNAIQYPGDQNIDVTYYKLNLDISYNSQTISGTVTINAKSTIDNLSSVFFDLQNYFTIHSVTINGSDLIRSFENNKISITLDKVYNIGEEFSIDITYSGTPGSSGFGSFEFSEHGSLGERAPAIWTLSEPYGSSDWWPSKDTPADKADSSDVWVRADELFVTVSNGTLIDVINHGDGTKTYKWKNKYPIAHYLISLAMTNYFVYEQQFEYEPGKFMPVVHYNYPENFNDPTKSRKEDLDKTTDMLKVFSELFGPYPFVEEKYGHAEFGWGGGMEHQTVSSMGTFREDVVAHELAHQWFGDMITCKDWQNIWLNEGFATYSEALYDEAKYEEAKYGKIAYFNNMLNEIQYAKNAVGSIYVQNVSTFGNIFNYVRSYAKGAVVLHMLRKVVGDEHFFNILKAYAGHPDFSYNVATTEDFQSVCETVSSQNLDYFFTQWIYGENYPKYSMHWESNNLGNDIYSVSVTINQQENSIPVFFTMPIDLKISTTVHDTIITIFNNKQTQDFTINVFGKPTQIQLDPESWILKDVTGITSTDEFENKIPNNFFLSQNYPNPFNPNTLINYSIPASTITNGASGYLVKLKVYDALGKEIATLVNEFKRAGNYSVEFESADYSAGVYYYKFDVGEYSKTRKMIILK